MTKLLRGDDTIDGERLYCMPLVKRHNCWVEADILSLDHAPESPCIPTARIGPRSQSLSSFRRFVARFPSSLYLPLRSPLFLHLNALAEVGGAGFSILPSQCCARPFNGPGMMTLHSSLNHVQFTRLLRPLFSTPTRLASYHVQAEPSITFSPPCRNGNSPAFHPSAASAPTPLSAFGL